MTRGIESQMMIASGHTFRLVFVGLSDGDLQYWMSELQCWMRELGEERLEIQYDVVETLEEFTGRLRFENYAVIVVDYKLRALAVLYTFEILKNTGSDMPFILITGRPPSEEPSWE
jgi:hypothetical protein